MNLFYKDIENRTGVLKGFKVLFALEWDIETLDKLESIQLKIEAEIKEYHNQKNNLTSKYCTIIDGELTFDTPMKQEKFSQRFSALLNREIQLGEKIKLSKKTLREYKMKFSPDAYKELKKVIDFIEE